MLKRFPNVDVVVIDAELKGSRALAEQVKQENRHLCLVGLSPRIGNHLVWADRTIDSHDPAGLLKLLESLGGRTDF